ncbi:MAG: class I SAM-dependent methyltransferase [bacterium]
MFKELIHFAVHAPSTLALKSRFTRMQLYDELMVRADEEGMAYWRETLVSDVGGDVLEVGCGTGLMFCHYKQGAKVAAIEPEAEFLERAIKRALDSEAAVSLSIADGLRMPFADETFDFVIIAMVLCSVPSVERVLNEVRRVLKKGGEVRLIEHVRSTNPIKGAVMDWLNPIWLKLNQQGCNMNRSTERLLEENGFLLKEVASFKIFTPGLPTFPKRWMRAVPNA